jgi:hypothetical protein
VHVQIKNGTQNGTVLGTSDCNERKKFVCEMRQKGAEGRALAVECMALWDVTEGFNSFCFKMRLVCLTGEFKCS